MWKGFEFFFSSFFSLRTYVGQLSVTKNMSSSRSSSVTKKPATTAEATKTPVTNNAGPKSPARRTSSFSKARPEDDQQSETESSPTAGRPASGNRRTSTFTEVTKTTVTTTTSVARPSSGGTKKPASFTKSDETDTGKGKGAGEPKSPARRSSSFAKVQEERETSVSPAISDAPRPSSGARRTSSFAPTDDKTKAKEEPRRGSVGRRDSSNDRNAARKESNAGDAAQPLTSDPNEFVEPPVTPWEHVFAQRGYILHGPSVQGGDLRSVIDSKLFRIIKKKGDDEGNDDGGAMMAEGEDGDEYWYFYNDTTDYEMQVLLKFAPGSTMKLGVPEDIHGKSAEGKASLVVPAGGGQHITLAIFPNQTRLACVGKHQGCSSQFTGKALTEEYHKMHAAITDKLVQPEIAAVRELCPKYVLDDEVVSICLRTGTKFVDLSFPPIYNSIYRDGIDTNFICPYPWRRPSDALPKEHAHESRLFVGGIDPADIDQGVLGNCWFLAAIACLAEFPDKIMDIFRHPVSAKIGQKERKIGAYRITLNINGWWKVILVDDFLPMSVVRSSFARTREDPRELWVSLLEKAYAKARGSYANIIGGDALEALEDLTGFPVNRFDTEWEDAVAAKDGGVAFAQNLVKFDKQNYLVVLNTPGYDPRHSEGLNDEQQEAKYKAAGLALGHAYTVMKTVFVEKLNLYLLNIRNPWGDGIEWTGDWSDSSAKWKQHPDVRDELGFVSAKDSQFWMSWKDVREHFCGGGVCFTKFGWHDYRVQGEFELGGIPSVVFEIRCTKKVEVFFTLSQTDERQNVGLPDSESGYGAIMLSVSRTKNGSVQEVHLSSTLDVDQPAAKYQFNYARDVGVQYTLDPANGPFFVIPRVHETDTKRPYVLGMISNVSVGPNLSVKFVKILPENPVFKNMQGFLVDKVLEVYTKWQYNPDVGGPKEFQGNTLRFLGTS